MNGLAPRDAQDLLRPDRERQPSRAARRNRVSQSAVSQQLRRSSSVRPAVGRARPRAGARGHRGRPAALPGLQAAARAVRGGGGPLRERPRRRSPAPCGWRRLQRGAAHLPATMKISRAHPRVNVRLDTCARPIYEACLAGRDRLGHRGPAPRATAVEVAPLARRRAAAVQPPTTPWPAAPPCPSPPWRGGPSSLRPGHPDPQADGPSCCSPSGWRWAGHGVDTRDDQAFGRGGDGYFLLPRPALTSEVRARTLVARRVREGAISRPVGAIYVRRRPLSPAARAFLELLTA